LDAHVK